MADLLASSLAAVSIKDEYSSNTPYEIETKLKNDGNEADDEKRKSGVVTRKKSPLFTAGADNAGNKKAARKKPKPSRSFRRAFWSAKRYADEDSDQSSERYDLFAVNKMDWEGLSD